MTIEVHDNFPRAGGQRNDGSSAPGPANLEVGGWFGDAQNLNRAVLRPITRAGMEFAHRSQAPVKPEAQNRPNPFRIARTASQPDPQSWARANVVIQPRLRAILRHNQVQAPIPVVIA